MYAKYPMYLGTCVRLFGFCVYKLFRVVNRRMREDGHTGVMVTLFCVSAELWIVGKTLYRPAGWVATSAKLLLFPSLLMKHIRGKRGERLYKNKFI